jgi:hypothetical protein
MKIGMKMIYSNMENIKNTKEYFDRLNEAGKQSPASWIIVSPRIAEELKNQIDKNDHKNNKLKK